MEELSQSGISLGWQEPSFDDSHWAKVKYSYGPYWWHIGPFEDGKEFGTLLEKAKQGELLLDQTYESAGKHLKWQPYTFSEKFGHFGNVHTVWGDCSGSRRISLSSVRRVLPKPLTIFSRMFTLSSEQGSTLFFGGKPEKAEYLASPSLTTRLECSTGFVPPDSRQAWVNGEEVLNITEKRGDEISTKIHLKKGWTPIVLRLSQRASLGKDIEGKLRDNWVPAHAERGRKQARYRNTASCNWRIPQELTPRKM